jgi:hypothetical protein
VKYYWNANISLGKIRNISYIPSPPSTLSVFLPLISSTVQAYRV